MILNPKTDRPASYINDDNDKSSQTINIVRLVEDTKITKKIRFDEMSIEGLYNPNDVQGGNKAEDEFGITFPIIRINDIMLSRYNIKSMSISSSDFVPTISLSLVYDNTTFISKNMPKDGDMVSLYLRANTNALSYLRNDFIITSCYSNSGRFNNSSIRVNIEGKMFIPELDSSQFCESFMGTSKEVLKQLAEKYKLGFAFNDFDDTNDFQNWIKTEPGEEFIADIVEHAWKDETSFFEAWIDLYYNLCYVNINKFLLSTENEETTDITFASNTLAIENLVNNNTGVENAQMTVKVLTNASEFKDTPFYIKKWEPINISSSISLESGYSTYTYTFTHNQNYLNGDQSQCFQELHNIPSYDQSKVDSFILLRGRSKYDKNKNPEDEKARVNHDFVNTYINIEWTGVEYTLDDDDSKKQQNEWSGNVHKNYARAPYHNKQNINELNKMFLRVECDGLNLQIMRGERVPVYIVPNNSYDKGSNETLTQNDTPKNENRFYTGYYIVDDVEISYHSAGNGETSNYTTTFTLKRREWPTPEAI